MSASTSPPTRDHGHIRLWAASQDAIPAELLPSHVDSEPTQLHFFIPGDITRQPRLRIIGWDDFFAAFEAHGLAFVYEILPDGTPGKGFEILNVEAKSFSSERSESATHDSDTAHEYVE